MSSKPEWDGDNADGSGKALHGDLLEFLAIECEGHEDSANNYVPVPVTEAEVLDENIFGYYNWCDVCLILTYLSQLTNTFYSWIFGNAHGDDKIRLKRIEEKKTSLYDDNPGPESEPNIRERAVARRKAQLLERLEATLLLDEDNARTTSEGVSYIDDNTGPGSQATPLEVFYPHAVMEPLDLDAQGSSSDAQMPGSDGVSS